MTRLPKALKIGGLKYEVRPSDLVYDEGEMALGNHQQMGNIIRINERVPEDQQMSSLLHEILEALNIIYALKLEHEQLDVLEAALFQVLEDNFPFWQENPQYSITVATDVK